MGKSKNQISSKIKNGRHLYENYYNLSSIDPILIQISLKKLGHEHILTFVFKSQV